MRIKPLLWERSVIFRIGEDISKKVNYDPKGDITKTVSSLGGRISFEEFSDLVASDTDSLIIYGPSNFQIILPTYTSLRCDKWLLAHEIGHYILHYVIPRAGDYSDKQTVTAPRYGHDSTEWEANWFASAFLLPRFLFHEEFRRTTSLYELSTTFGLSPRVIKSRIDHMKEYDL